MAAAIEIVTGTRQNHGVARLQGLGANHSCNGIGVVVKAVGCPTRRLQEHDIDD
jgi:hypothetical protein